jgi:hypothetical protein
VAFIESHEQIERHPKTLDLSARMGWDVDQTIGKLHRFWWWCLNFAATGDLRGKNDAVLAGSVGLDASDGKRFVESMVASGWIDRADEVFRVHDWIDYAGTYLRTSKFKRRPDLWAETQRLYGRDGCPVNVTGLSGQPTHLPTHPPNGVGGRNGNRVKEDRDRFAKELESR